MSEPLDDAVALITGASSGIGAATARSLARQGATVVLVARRKDRLDGVVAEIEQAGGRAWAIEADITERDRATAAVTETVERLGRLDILVNNAGMMLLGPIVDADVEEWDRMLQINTIGVLNMIHAALPHLLNAAEQEPRRVADLVNVSSLGGRRANSGSGVYNLTKFGLNGLTESLRQEVTKRHVRVGVIEPGAVATELGSHNRPEIQAGMTFYNEIETLVADDIADAILYMVTQPRRAIIRELYITPTEQEL
jgi:NADP-dependent 3-hydroxy acid dehydrogenase YdfG